ncbi:MAG: 2-C-methyl-D-erythritol 2,4-cyclodiphosphate synthase [Ruminococcaceae bacterium]|nr:2-C-methyl-D-erythritol 2,4-cyclodiphosphate synthase [Oscillospiraceae bacterium]
MRIGIGYDAHRLVEDRELIIGGVKIPHSKGLLGHSDADVLLHAVCDALLGAAGLGDIGKHFPDKDPKYKGISSMLLLEHTVSLLKTEGYKVVNIDCTVVAQAPKIAPYIDEIKHNIEKITSAPVNVKATTEEHMGFTGRGEGISSHAVALIELEK